MRNAKEMRSRSVTLELLPTKFAFLGDHVLFSDKFNHLLVECSTSPQPTDHRTFLEDQMFSIATKVSGPCALHRNECGKLRVLLLGMGALQKAAAGYLA